MLARFSILKRLFNPSSLKNSDILHLDEITMPEGSSLIDDSDDLFFWNQSSPFYIHMKLKEWLDSIPLHPQLLKYLLLHLQSISAQIYFLRLIKKEDILTYCEPGFDFYYTSFFVHWNQLSFEKRSLYFSQLEHVLFKKGQHDVLNFLKQHNLMAPHEGQTLQTLHHFNLASFFISILLKNPRSLHFLNVWFDSWHTEPFEHKFESLYPALIIDTATFNFLDVRWTLFECEQFLYNAPQEVLVLNPFFESWILDSNFSYRSFSKYLTLPSSSSSINFQVITPLQQWIVPMVKGKYHSCVNLHSLCTHSQ